MHENFPVLVIERTVEVPSGHNVGQRFGRLVAAAEASVPCVYFGPYVAFKHGGPTQGPRYMNLRLFDSIKKVEEITSTSLTTIKWPVDKDFEIIRDATKDKRIKEYLNLYFDLCEKNNYDLKKVSGLLISSSFYEEQKKEIELFIQTVKRAGDYSLPPESVSIGKPSGIEELRHFADRISCDDVLFYRVGMRNIRSDPYTGMGILYAYLYCGGMINRTRKMILHFPFISKKTWDTAATGARKDIRMFKMIADWILFKDNFEERNNL